MEETISVKFRGPMLDGRAAMMVSSRVRSAALAAAMYAEEQVQNVLTEVLQYPTGSYQGRINIRPVNQYAYRVNDDNCVYGPWLEGTGSRNAPVTRFPGYHTFRRVTDELQGTGVMPIVEGEISQAVSEINTI